MGRIEALGVGLRVEPCPPLPAGLGGSVGRTVAVPATALRPEELLVQLPGGGERSLTISASMAAGERYEFDLIAAGRALEAIECSGFFPPAVIADDETIDALAEGTGPLPLPSTPRLQSGNPKEGDNLVHL